MANTKSARIKNDIGLFCAHEHEHSDHEYSTALKIFFLNILEYLGIFWNIPEYSGITPKSVKPENSKLIFKQLSSTLALHRQKTLYTVQLYIAEEQNLCIACSDNHIAKNSARTVCFG